MNRRDPARVLASLERIAHRHGSDLAQRKLERLTELGQARLRRASQVARLHRVLCYLAAFPDAPGILRRVQQMLRGFDKRPDLRRHRAALAGSGIAGTDTPYRFFWPTAKWISQTWPGALRLDRDDPQALDALLRALPQILDRPQAEWLQSQSARTLHDLDRLLPPGITDADYIIGRVARMAGDEFFREAWFDRLDPPFVLASGRDTPERSTARFPGLSPRYVAAVTPGRRPDLRHEARRGPLRTRRLGSRGARELIRLARISMITRERDLEVFEYPNASDAFLVDDGDGLAFALLGIARERRATLAATWAGLMLQGGVPIGYVQLDVLGGHAALSFNLFGDFRGSGAARVFARFVAATHHLFGCDEFSIEPYQLGLGNDEGIESGAWWFYRKMGFRPQAAAARRLAAREQARLDRNPRYRSSRRTLRQLARSHLLFALDPARRPRRPRIAAWLAASARALRRYRDADPLLQRERAAADAARHIGAARAAVLTAPTREWLARWSGLILAWSVRSRWNAGDRRALRRLLVAKSGRSEHGYQRLLLRQKRLRSLLGC